MANRGVQRCWPQYQVNSSNFPYMAFVAEGEADLPFGVTESQAKALKKEWGESKIAGRYVLSLPAASCVVIPPGVPCPMGVPHWERAHPETARSHIFWVRVLPSGVLCHACITRGQRHDSDPNLFLYDPQLSTLTELLLDEMRKREARSEAVVSAYLLALLLRIEREMQTGQAVLTTGEMNDHLTLDELPAANLHAATLQRACHYVQTHLYQPLSPEHIARRTYVSPSYLNRVFREEMDLSIMGYVARCRQETAQTLLQNTDLPVAEIGRCIGYATPPHFTRSFRRWTQSSPVEYRKRHHKSSD